MERYPEHSDRRIWLGVVLLVLGGGLLLKQLNIFPYELSYYLFNIWSLFLAVGFILIAVARRTVPGVIFLALGAFGLLRRMDLFIFDFNLFSLFWPVVIIVIGIALIIRRGGPGPGPQGRTPGSGFSGDGPDGTGPEGQSRGASSSGYGDYVEDFAVFGGRERTINSQNFQGGKITAMFGGSEIDLRNSSLAPGTHLLDVFVIFGGTHITVPPDWTVRVEVFSLLGGFSDNRYSTLKVIPDSEKVLVIKGFVMFGGGEVSLSRK